MKNHLLALLLALCCFSNCKEDEMPRVDDDTTNVTPPTELTNTNILLVIADDVGLDATPGYENGAMKANMPHLAALAADGITFDNAWAMPVCAPTRASIISGRYGYRTGVLNAESASRIPTTETTIQAYLDDHTNEGYSNAVFGKWHLSGNDADGPATMGVSEFGGMLSGGVADYSDWTLVQNGVSTATEEYATSKITDMAIDWINEQNQAWFCWVAYNAAHTPFHLPPANLHQQGDLPDDDASIEANPLPYYLAMLESLDTEMGRLLDNIPADELENTVIVFIGDNGTPGPVVQSPYVQNRSKGSLYQGGVHVPMVVAGKGVSRQGQRDNSLVNSTDLFATVAEITGINLPQYEDSQSIKPTFTSANAGTRNYNYAEVLVNDNANKSGHTIRNDRYKLIQFDSGTRRFFDLQEDPYESVNLINGGLSTAETAALEGLEEALLTIRN